MLTRMLVPALLLVFAAPSLADEREAAAEAAEASGHLRDAFGLYLQAYQALPEPPPEDADLRLRERLAKLASRLDPPPALPDEAQRFAVRGQVLFGQATSPQDLAAAEQEMHKAIRAAPWDPALAFNLALIQEKAERYGPALANVRLYLSTEPADVAQAKTVLYRLELEAEQAMERSKHPVAVQDPTSPGRVYIYRPKKFIGGAVAVTIRCDGGKLGKVGSGRYLAVAVRPGLHSFEVGGSSVAIAVTSGDDVFLKATRGFSEDLQPVSRQTWEAESRKLKPTDNDKVESSCVP